MSISLEVRLARPFEAWHGTARGCPRWQPDEGPVDRRALCLCRAHAALRAESRRRLASSVLATGAVLYLVWTRNMLFTLEGPRAGAYGDLETLGFYAFRVWPSKDPAVPRPSAVVAGPAAGADCRSWRDRRGGLVRRLLCG